MKRADSVNRQIFERLAQLKVKLSLDANMAQNLAPIFSGTIPMQEQNDGFP